MDVQQIMTWQPATLSPTAAPGFIPITEEGRLEGIVTDRDIVVRGIAVGKDPRECAIAEIMSAGPVTVTPKSSVDDASRLVAEHQARRLPVVDEGKLVGIVVLGQLAREEDRGEAGETLKEISEPN